MSQIFYKYRSLRSPDAYKYLLDILLNKRVYAADFEELNDPMEGVFRHDGYDPETLQKIYSSKKSLRICSFSRELYHPLMWAHYADGNRGVVLAVSIRGVHEIVEMVYEGCSYVKHALEQGADKTARNIFRHKLPEWEYEDEVRVLTEKNFVPVKIHKIILGNRIDSLDANLIEGLAKRLKIPTIERQWW